jgi:hypothetical protein
VIAFLIISFILTLLLWPVLTKSLCSKKEIKSKATLLAICAAVDIPLSLGVYGICMATQREYEAWTYKIISVEHWEQWTTHETRTETYTTGSGENQQTHTRIVHYTEKHGPYWYAIDEYRKKHSINRTDYDKWKNIWVVENQIGFNNGSAAHFWESKDGRIFGCSWDNNFNTMYPFVEIKTYENRVRRSQSVFRTKEPTREIKKRFKLPLNEHNVSPVICYNGAVVSESDLLYLNRINALLGPQNEMRLLFVLFKGEPRSVVHDILSAWNGPNMNEFVVFIGLNGQRIAWIDVESWADQTSLHGLVEGEFLISSSAFPKLASSSTTTGIIGKGKVLRKTSLTFSLLYNGGHG